MSQLVVNQAVRSCCGQPAANCTCGGRSDPKPEREPEYEIARDLDEVKNRGGMYSDDEDDDEDEEEETDGERNRRRLGLNAHVDPHVGMADAEEGHRPTVNSLSELWRVRWLLTPLSLRC